MTKKAVTAEAKGVAHKKGNVVVATTFGLKVPRRTHEITSSRVVTATSGMPQEEEKRTNVYTARKHIFVPK